MILAQLLHYVAKILNVPSSNVLAWTYTCVILERPQGNMRECLAFVGNSVAEMSEHIFCPVGTTLGVTKILPIVPLEGFSS